MSTRHPRHKRSKPKNRDSLEPLNVGADGEYFDDLEQADGGEASEYVPDSRGYQESGFETTMVRCCGGCCLILIGLCVLAWVVHAIPVATINDIPPFARSLIWMSLAHHTDAWKIQQGGVSPPPPAFGDGRGNFPDLNPSPPSFRL